MDFKAIGSKIGKTLDGKKGEKIGIAIAQVFEEALPMLIKIALDENLVIEVNDSSGKCNNEKEPKENKIFGFETAVPKPD